jgi:hypothetical protein
MACLAADRVSVDVGPILFLACLVLPVVFYIARATVRVVVAWWCEKRDRKRRGFEVVRR